MKFLMLLSLLVLPLRAYAQDGQRMCPPVAPGADPYPATEYFYDHDGDTVVEKNPTVWLCGFENLPHKISGPVGTISSDHDDSFDCAPGDPNRYQPTYVYGPDKDGDGYPSTMTSEPFRICVGSAVSYNGWDMQGMGGNAAIDCDDNDITVPYSFVYIDSDKDGAVDDSSRSFHCLNDAVIGKPYVSQMVPGVYSGYPWPVDSTRPVIEDCAKDNPNIKGGVDFYLDRDGDGLGSGELLTLCGEVLDGVMSVVEVPLGYSKFDTDCNDNNPEVGTDCSLRWDWDKYYDGEQDQKIVMAQPYENFGYGFDVNLLDYLEYNGDDRDSLKFEVECSFCADGGRLNGSFFNGPVIANSRDEFENIAGIKKAVVKVTNKQGTTVKANVNFRVITGHAVLYINGIRTEVVEKSDDDTLNCRNGVLDDDGRCDRGAKGAAKKLRNVTQDFLLQFVSGGSSEYLKYDFAHNPTRWSGLHDVFLECLAAWGADQDDAKYYEMKKDFIRLAKFGSKISFEEKYPGLVADLETRRLNATLKAMSTDLIPFNDFVSVKNKLNSLLRKGYRVTMISHSQGNFISNQVYVDLSEEAKKFVNQVQVAAPTTHNSDGTNRYVTGVNDLIFSFSINGRLPNTVLECGVLGHNFMDCYLGGDNQSASAAVKVIDFVKETAKELTERFIPKAR